MIATKSFRREGRSGVGRLSPLWSLIACLLCGSAAHAAHSFASVVDATTPKIVKIYGAGGVRGLEGYQSGFLISSDGHVLTVWSYVLDTDFITAVLDDGRRFQAELIGYDPRIELAVLKIDATDLPYFELQTAVDLVPGARVLAFSNLFGVAAGSEPASVLHGSVSARTKLSARRGVFETPYRDWAYILDAMTNNPGAAGGVLTDRLGNPVGMLGKELRNSLDNTWLNYAIPIDALEESVQQILAGNFRPRRSDPQQRKPLEPVSLDLLGLVLIPDVLANTPPFIDQVLPGSPAADADLRPDDMILFVNDRMTRSASALKEELGYIDRIDEVRLVVQRDQQLLSKALFAANP